LVSPELLLRLAHGLGASSRRLQNARRKTTINTTAVFLVSTMHSCAIPSRRITDRLDLLVSPTRERALPREASSLKAGVRAVHRVEEFGAYDLQARRVQHRLEEPPEGAVFGGYVHSKILTRVSHFRILGCTSEPALDAVSNLERPEVVDKVAHAQNPAWPEQVGKTLEWPATTR
jgi:hypothetical protein